MLSLKEPYPDAQFLLFGISPYIRVEEQISTPSDLSLLLQLKTVREFVHYLECR